MHSSSTSEPSGLKRALYQLRAFWGVERNSTSHTEKLVSALGAFLGILTVWWGMTAFVGEEILSLNGQLLMVTSMGATAVLLFAVPQGALSQPWPVLGGHMISAFIGVSCYWAFSEYMWAPAAAVGLAVGAMYYGRCIHPPGGATALAAVLGGPEVHNLAYFYLLMPILANVLLILLAAFAFNACFSWRRYPAHLNRRPLVQPASVTRQFELTQEDFLAAIQELDSYVDINHEHLTHLLELAKQHAEKSPRHPEVILSGHYYSNGKLGKQWSIRQVIAIDEASLDINEQVYYRVVAGDGEGITRHCQRAVFRQWARYEVVAEDNGHWAKVLVD